MFEEWFVGLPGWLTLGVAVGLTASFGLALVFLAANRWFPDPPAETGATVDGTVRRKAEIRDYLRRIDERYAEEYELDGVRVAFYLPERSVAITFDARAYFRLKRASDAGDVDPDLFVVLCEHEMPGHQLGRRLPFEVPDVFLGADVEPDPTTAAFEALGLPPGADEDDVQRAYREQVKDVHPDQGGSREEFTRVREAYTTALDHVGDGT
ncbi:J domain-containing protein [Candidatus Halobonum tyrrellensis]|uniref:J domain-containing protein n=1 Tax=Candidatus Halobonum tyrrellensis TaxID=1431545 RepID=UPI00067833CD|nr:J domain-containing protein [Candidatus Halobonum tyrrellensis]